MLVIDDGSTDRSAEMAELADRQIAPRFTGSYALSGPMTPKVIHHPTNMGKGAALKTGFTAANGADIIVVMDTDSQHDPEEIEKVIAPIINGEADVSIGLRFMKGNEIKIPLYQKAGIKILDFVTNKGSGMKITDIQSGFGAYSKEAIQKIRINDKGMSAGSEILLQIKKHGFKVKEVPISSRYDIENTSTQNPVVHGVIVLFNILIEIGHNLPLFSFIVPGNWRSHLVTHAKGLRVTEYEHEVFAGNEVCSCQ